MCQVYLFYSEAGSPRGKKKKKLWRGLKRELQPLRESPTVLGVMWADTEVFYFVAGDNNTSDSAAERGKENISEDHEEEDLFVNKTERLIFRMYAEIHIWYSTPLICIRNRIRPMGGGEKKTCLNEAIAAAFSLSFSVEAIFLKIWKAAQPPKKKAILINNYLTVYYHWHWPWNVIRWTVRYRYSQP